MSDPPEPDYLERARVYDRLQASAQAGVDRAAVADCATKYETLADGTPRALPYDLPNAVRLLCTKIGGPDGGDALRDASARACEAFVAALPPGYRVHQNPPASYHSTVFHTGQPTEFRPKSNEEIAEEVALARELVSATPAIPVAVHRLVLASSGVLLVLLSAPDGGVSPTDDLRVRCRAAWPDAPAKQASYVMHVSLCRILEMPPPPEESGASASSESPSEAWRRVMERVETLSEGLKGLRATLRTVWHVEEKMQMTCGDVTMGCVVTDLPLGASR